jgi:hypothetical protein
MLLLHYDATEVCMRVLVGTGTMFVVELIGAMHLTYRSDDRLSL